MKWVLILTIINSEVEASIHYTINYHLRLGRWQHSRTVVILK